MARHVWLTRRFSGPAAPAAKPQRETEHGANTGPDGQSKPFEIAPDTEIQHRAREVQFLLNVVEPDPEYQPFVLTDGASLFDAVGLDEDEIRRRLGAYFGQPFAFDLSQPVWRLVDEIRTWRPGWPEEC